MGKILWLTDIHYTTSSSWDKKLVDGKLMRDDKIGELLNKIASRLSDEEEIDKIIFGGDFVGSIRNSTFQNLVHMVDDISNFCSKFPEAEKVFITGNHDVRFFDNIQQITNLFKDIPNSKIIQSPGYYAEEWNENTLYYISYDKNLGMVERLNTLNIDEEQNNYMFGHFGDSVALKFVDNDDIIDYDKVKKQLNKFEHIWLGHLHYFFEHDNITYTSSLTTQNFSDAIQYTDLVSNNFKKKYTYTLIDEDMNPEYRDVLLDNYMFVNVPSDYNEDVLETTLNDLEEHYFVFRVNENVYKEFLDKFKDRNNIVHIAKHSTQDLKNGIKYIEKEVEGYDEIEDVYSYFVKHGLENFEDKDMALEVLEEAIKAD